MQHNRSDPNAHDLRSGPLALDDISVFERCARLLPLGGRRVVEIGGCLARTAVEARGVSSWLAIDPRNRAGHAGVVTAVRGSAQHIPAADRTVDLVFSCNALQHVQPLAEVLAEVCRVLAPGGAAYFAFGPVWSAPDGAHIEGLVCDGRRYDFWNHSLLPAWSHLVLDPLELVDLLEPWHGHSLASAVAAWVCGSDWINRRPLHVLLDLVAAAGLDLLSVRGCQEFGYAYDPPVVPEDHPLAARFEAGALARAAFERHGIPAAHLPVRDVELIAAPADRRPR